MDWLVLKMLLILTLGKILKKRKELTKKAKIEMTRRKVKSILLFVYWVIFGKKNVFISNYQEYYRFLIHIMFNYT